MATLQVIRMGHPLLLEKAEDLTMEEIKTKKFQQFVDDLTETMRESQGVGIAGPQVACMKRIFLMEVAGSERYPEKEEFPLQIVINPQLEFPDSEQIDSWEGCLSIPNIRGRLKRFIRVNLSGLDRHGNPISMKLEGFPAIIAQHENDHLNGVLFLHRMESLDTLSFQEEFSRFWVGER